MAMVMVMALPQVMGDSDADGACRQMAMVSSQA
jgi:hypothetical protein